MAKAGLAHVSAGTRTVWSGYASKVGTFVYVYLYRTSAAAAARAQELSAEEVGVAGSYLITQSIAPYHNSPVRVVTECLGGRPPKNPPAQKPGAFTF